MKIIIRIFNYTAKNWIILFSENLQIFVKKSSNLQQKILKSSEKNLRFLLQQPYIYHRQNTTTSRQSVGGLSAVTALSSFLVGCM